MVRLLSPRKKMTTAARPTAKGWNEHLRALRQVLLPRPRRAHLPQAQVESSDSYARRHVHHRAWRPVGQLVLPPLHRLLRHLFRAEEKTSWGKALSGALVSILAGLAVSSAGLVTPGTPALGVVMEYLLPIAVPPLLLGADLRRVFRTTGDLLKAFLIGSAATIIGTTVAYLLFLMRSMGQESWKIAAALMGSYIGGQESWKIAAALMGSYIGGARQR